MSDSDVRHSVLVALQEHKLRTRGAPSAGHYTPKHKLTRKCAVSALMAERIRMHAGSGDSPLKEVTLGPRSSPATYNTDVAANATHKLHPRGTIGNAPRGEPVLQWDECPSPGPSDYHKQLPRDAKLGAGFSRSKSTRFPAKMNRGLSDEANTKLNPQQGAIRVQHPRVTFGQEARPYDKADERLPVPSMGSGPGNTFSPGPDHYNYALPSPLNSHSGTIPKAQRVFVPIASGEDAYMSANTSSVGQYRDAGPKYLTHGQATKIRCGRSPTHKLLGRHGTSLGTGRDWLFSSCY